MFEHSVKVPRHFKTAANIFKKVSTEGGSIKTLLYDDKLRHFRTNVLYALLTETIKHAAHIDKIFETCGVLVNEPRLDPWLAKVLTAELLFGKKSLPGKSKPEQTILSYKEQFEKFSTEHQDDNTPKVIFRPRYVRVNTNLLTTSDAIRAFQDEGYKFIRCTSGSYDDYLKQIQSLTQYDFTQDYHIKTIFVFAPGTKFHDHDLYLENQIILQDKATALAVHLLAPPPGSVVLDMCAAPGMKTTQLAAFLKNQGKIYAVERNEERYQTLCDFVKKTESKCVETLHKDSLDIKRGDYDDVEYIILDPSCSGSGMQLCVHNYVDDVRLAKLTSLQEKFLKHAMNSFPNAKRIVYSTCSLFHEENERVVTNIVKASRARWRVLDVKELLKGHWNNFGSGMYGSMGTRCLYAKPESDYTTGFFLAVLDREPKDKSHDKNNSNGLRHNKSKIDKQESESIINEENEEFNKDQVEEKTNFKKKIKKGSIDTSNNESSVNNAATKSEDNMKNDNGMIKKKRNKYKENVTDSNMDYKNETINDAHEQEETMLHENKNNILDDVDKKISKKKKKKDKVKVEDESILVNAGDDNHELSRKKKKNKARENEESTPDSKSVELNDQIDLTDLIDCFQKTAKKRKHKHKVPEESVLSLHTKDEYTNDRNIVNLVDELSNKNEIIHLIDDDQKSKKKKKKDKIRNKEESISNLGTIEDELLNDNDISVVKFKKKKKKRDKDESTLNKINENDVINVGDEDQTSSSKKKKRKVNENESIDITGVENGVEVYKRKKKFKHIDNDHEDIVEMPRKKKHKTFD